MKFVITITTYNRAEECASLIRQIHRFSPDIEKNVLIIDDFSDANYNHVIELCYEYGYTFKRMAFHHGKMKHWIIADMCIQFGAKNTNKDDYYFYLQDDLILHEDFFNKCINAFESIPDKYKCVLNPCLDTRTGKIWTHIQETIVPGLPIKKTGWIDLRFMATKRFFLIVRRIISISELRWENDNTLSSGVGKQISQRLARFNIPIYQTTYSLYTHGESESLMNPESRKINDLRSL